MTQDGYNKETTDAIVKRLDDKVDHFRSDMTESFKGVYDRQDKTNGRLRFVEKLAWIAIGVSSAITFEGGIRIIENIWG